VNFIPWNCCYCKKEIDDVLPFKCKHCNEYYCIDHFLPENHNCKYYNPPQWKSQPIKTVQPDNNYSPSAIEPEIQQTNEAEKYVFETTTKPKKRKNHSLRRNIALLIVIVIFSIVLVGGYLILKQNYSDIRDKKNRLESELSFTDGYISRTSSLLNSCNIELTQLNDNLHDNISKVNLLKMGNKYSLHDPIYDDVTSFIKSDKSNDLTTEIENAKNQGIQCAYVLIQLSASSEGVYILIGFNTTDKGMVYFEPETDYRVRPIIGYSYVECVEGRPYYSTDDDTIINILVVW